MGGITSVATTAIQALGAVNTVLGAIDSYQNNSGRREYNQQKALIDLENKQARERAAYEKEQIRLNAEKTESERLDALRRAMAKRRASYGADGIGSYDGSSEAVLLGLFEESDEKRQQREALDTLKKASVDQDVSQRQRLNTLKLTQLKERNRIKEATSIFDAVGSVF